VKEKSESDTARVTIDTSEKEETLAKSAENCPKELKRTEVSRKGRCDRIQPANAAHKICSREMDLAKYNEDGVELKNSNEEIQEPWGDDFSREDSRPRQG